MPAEDLDIAHMEWLVTRRSRNQASTLELLRLFQRYSARHKTTDLSAKSSRLVAVGFSLWRAVFLADKEVTRERVFEDASAFLAKLVADNAIGYAQDRNAREWTFNYYMNAAIGA